MPFIVAILASLALFSGFLVLTRLERRRGARFLEGARASLDRRASHAARAVRSADFLGLVAHAVRVVAGHIIHDVASVALAGVRAFERFLTELVRELRGTRDAARPETRSRFVKSMSYFKRTLKNPHVATTSEDALG